jgi:hypothetical protein
MSFSSVEPYLLVLFGAGGVIASIAYVFYERSETMKGGALLALGFVVAPIFIGLGEQFRDGLYVNLGVLATLFLAWRMSKHFQSNAPHIQRRMEEWARRRREREQQMEERQRAKGNDR